VGAALQRATKARTTLGLVLALTVFGATYGFAATLGAASQALGAGNAVVVSCQTSGTPTGAYNTTYDASLGGYRVTGVTVTGIDPGCNGKTVSVTLTNATNLALASGVATYSSAGSNTTLAISSLNATPAASAVSGLSVAVNG
jgi:hypothetical protein